MNTFRYCPVGEPHRLFGLFITGGGREVTRAGESYPHEHHSSDYYFTWDQGRKLAGWEYQLLYILKGAGEIEFEPGRPIPLKEGTAVILLPGEWHRYRPNTETGWEEAYIGFGGAAVPAMIQPPFFAERAIVCQFRDRHAFESQLLPLIELIQTRGTELPYTLATRTATLIATMIEDMKLTNTETSRYAKIRKATLFIAHRLNEVIDFPSLAETLEMSYSLFRKRFRDYTGLAPLEFQNALRIKRASHLLICSDIPLARIAADTGFRTHAYFARFFHKKTGLSPSEFRQRKGNVSSMR